MLTEKAPGTSYNITLGHLFITWILPLEFKAKCRILTPYFMVFSDSFASLFLIHELLISSGVIILSSLLTIISSLHLFCLLWLTFSRHKLTHANKLYGAVFRILVSLVRQEKTMEGWTSIRPSFFSSSKKRIFNTELCRARYLVGARAEQQASTCDVESWDLLQIRRHQMMDSSPFFFADKLSLEGAAGTTPVRQRWY